MNQTPPPIYFDSVVVINFGKVGASWVLKNLYQSRAAIVEEVQEEVKGVNLGWFRIVQLNEPKQLRLFDEYRKTLDKGEAATIVAAKEEGGIVATDDRDARKLAENKAGLTVRGTIYILAKAVNQGVISTQRADDLHDKMVKKAGYFSPVCSIKSYLS